MTWIARLREAGLDDAAILDVAVAANLRQFGSRVFAALGVEPDPFFLEQTDLVQAIPAEAAVRPSSSHRDSSVPRRRRRCAGESPVSCHRALRVVRFTRNFVPAAQ